MRARTNISLKDRKSLTLSDFKGVDFSSSPLRVKNNRATSMRNFINEYGVNKKRNGWNEVLKFEGSQINGIFQFGDDIIVYAGTKFYKVAESDGVYSKIEITTPPGVELQPNRIQAFFNKGKAYIIGCGDYLVYGSWDDGDTYELRRVADVAYIPTTTISIDNASIADNARATLDDINCLSSKRINQLVGVSEKVLELQEAIKSDSAVTIMLNSQKTETETETETETGTETETETETGTETETEITTITNKVTETFNGESYTTYSEYLYNGSGDTKKVWGRIDFAKGKILVPYTNFLEGFSSSSKITVMYNTDKSKEFEVESSFTWTLDASIDESTLVEITLETLEGKDAVSYTITNASDASTYGKNLYKVKKNGENFTSELCGTLDWGKQTQNAKINLTCSTVTQIENRDNIFVKFYHTNSGYEDRITKCTFGTLFGVEGNTDRLFLSGNPDYPNMDFHSEEDDYTYFSDLGSAALGSEAVAIKGYGRLSDSNLVIYKEESGQETSIFYRTGYYDTKYDSEGNIKSRRGIFPHRAGSIGEGCVSTYACVNFAGDSLLLSSNGVFGVVLASNVATAERYTRERSRTINERLRTQNLSDAVGIVYKNRYYLSVDGVCYVADARYKFATEDDPDGSYNYEWWYWDNIPARVFTNINGILYFGTKDGRICMFDDKYTDRTYTEYSGEGVFSVDITEGTITYPNTMNLSDNDIVTFNDLYSLLLPSSYVDVKEDGRVMVKEYRIQNEKGEDVDIEPIYDFRDGMEVYVDFVENTGLSVNTKYIVREVDPGTRTFALYTQTSSASGGLTESKITVNAGGFNIYQRHKDEELYVTNVNTGDSKFQVKKYKTGEVLKLSMYNGIAVSISNAKFSHFRNVVAEWYTPVFDLGTNESSKTLLKMTLSTVPETNGKVSFGYSTRNVDKIINAKGINVFSFDDFSFENFSLNPTFANSYSVKCNERNFNYIVFRFYSDNNSDCRVNALTIIYKINKSNRGVM